MGVFEMLFELNLSKTAFYQISSLIIREAMKMSWNNGIYFNQT